MPTDAAKPKGAILSARQISDLLDAADAGNVITKVATLHLAGRKAEAQRLRRRAWTLATTRQQQIELTYRAASQDSEFRQMITDADRARDGRNWSSAEQLYARALRLYPLHGGYRVQLAHVLKEQDRLKAAEVQYRSALALGAAPLDVEEHLAFVLARQDYRGSQPPSAVKDGAPMVAPPSDHDVHTLAYLIWRQERADEDDVLGFLRHCATCEAVAVAMAQDRRFAAGNRTFMEILRDLK